VACSTIVANWSARAGETVEAAALAEVELELAATGAEAGVDRSALALLEQAHTTAATTTSQPSISRRVATSGLQYCQDRNVCELEKS
jgi:hypothetical protein